MKEGFGTRAVGGLNMAAAPHLIDDSELRQSVNGWTSEDGTWTTAPGPVLKWGGYSNITCLAAGRMNGVDHVVWLDGNSLYDNGTNVGEITAGSSMDIVALDDGFLILGAAKNYIWDGAHLREQGTWQPSYIYSVNEHGTGATAGWPTITAISIDSPCVVTLNSNPFHAGDRVYISGITGTTELNDRYFTVAASTPGTGGTITLDEDSSGHTPWTSGGSVNGQCDLVGKYKFYYTQTITLSDGTVLESSPRGLLVEESPNTTPITHWDLGPSDSWDATEIDISEGEYVIAGIAHGSPSEYVRLYFNIDGTDLFDCTGTYTRGARIYRTKANGYDFYLEREYTEDDDEVSEFDDGTNTGIELPRMMLGIPDRDLGAVYVPGISDHKNAPAATTGDVSAYRCLINSADYPDRVYWSGLDGIEFFNDSTWWDKRPDTVTGIIGYRDGFVVWSCDRMWYVQFIDDLPQWEEIPTTVGLTDPKAAWIHGGAVVWLRDDGLWSWSGGEPVKVSRIAFGDITNPSSVTAAGDYLYVSGSDKSYVAIRRDGGLVWHEVGQAYPYAAGTNGKIFAADQVSVYQLFAGSKRGGSLRSKHFGNNVLGKAVRVVIDMKGETVPTLWINGNIQSDVIGHTEETRHTEEGVRKLARISVPRLNNQFVELQLEMTGDIDIYGYWIEVAR